jgi:hypothetical protein
VFLVEAVVGEAAVEDADESVAESPEGLVVEVAGGSVLVGVGPTSGAVGDRAEGPLVDGVVEAPFTDVAGQDGPFLAGGHGER